MKKALFALVALFTAGNAHANAPEDPQRSIADIVSGNAIEALVQQAREQAPLGLNWSVGDKNDYSIKIIFGKGTLNSVVREETDIGFWVEQVADIMNQQQKIEILFDKRTAQVLKLIVNGEDQEVQEPNIEILDNREETITVPAGTFDTIWIKAKDHNQNQEVEQWIAPTTVPIGGMVKAVQQSQIGKVVIELTSYVFGRD